MKTFIATFLFLVISFHASADYLYQVPVDIVINFPKAAYQHIVDWKNRNTSTSSVKGPSPIPPSKCYLTRGTGKNPKKSMMICSGAKIDCSHLPVSQIDPMAVGIMMGSFVPRNDIQMFVVNTSDIPAIVEDMKGREFLSQAVGQDFVFSRRVASSRGLKVEMTGNDSASSMLDDIAKGNVQTYDYSTQKIRKMTPAELQHMKSNVMYPCKINGVDQPCPEPPAPIRIDPFYYSGGTTPASVDERRIPGSERDFVKEYEVVEPDSATDSSEPQQ